MAIWKSSLKHKRHHREVQFPHGWQVVTFILLIKKTQDRLTQSLVHCAVGKRSTPSTKHLIVLVRKAMTVVCLRLLNRCAVSGRICGRRVGLVTRMRNGSRTQQASNLPKPGQFLSENQWPITCLNNTHKCLICTTCLLEPHGQSSRWVLLDGAWSKRRQRRMQWHIR